MPNADRSVAGEFRLPVSIARCRAAKRISLPNNCLLGIRKLSKRVEKDQANVMRDDQPEWRKHSKKITEAPSRLGTGRLVWQIWTSGQGADESVDVGAFEGHRWGWCSCPRPR